MASRGGGWKALSNILKFIAVVACIAAIVTGVLALVGGLGITLLGTSGTVTSVSVGPTFSIFGISGIPVVTAALTGGAILAAAGASAATQMAENKQHDHTIKEVNKNINAQTLELDRSIRTIVQEANKPLEAKIDALAAKLEGKASSPAPTATPEKTAAQPAVIEAAIQQRA